MDAFTRETMQVVNETMGLCITTEAGLDDFLDRLHDYPRGTVDRLAARMGFKEDRVSSTNADT